MLLKNAIDANKIIRPKNVSKFVFVCGGNKNKTEISERRKALLKFASHHLPHNKFFLAERVFEFLQAEGDNGNLIDIENKISKFSDYIIIVLESPSSFAELGAFSHQELRSKLIVINDKKFEHEKSFINRGPIKAIHEKVGKERIISYPMHNDGLMNLDGIGFSFAPLYEILKEPLTQKQESLSSDSVNPSKSFDRDSVRFIHDLIFMTGPILHTEIIEVLKFLFGKNEYKPVLQHLGMLGAFDAIKRDEKTKLYQSKLEEPFLRYKFDMEEVSSAFRNYILRHRPQRYYGT